MFTIRLKEVLFFGYHGLYEQERKTGNFYTVDVWLKYLHGTEKTTLQNTIDYVEVFNIISKRMAIPTHLLENLSTSIVKDLSLQFPFAKTIEVSIIKKNPPIQGFNGDVGVCYTLESK